MNKIVDTYLRIIKKFIENKPESYAVGLDIGSSECKLVELAREGKIFRLESYAIEPIVKDDVRDAVQRLMGRLKHPCKSLYTAVFGKGTLIRYIDMPVMSLEDLRNSFALEADKYFPFSQDQVYTDCFILEKEGKGRQMSVMAAAAKKELIDPRVALLGKLGFTVDFIGINPIALANVVNVLGASGLNSEDSVVAILDMGETVSNLTILVNKIPRFTRDIFVGGRDLSKRISNALGVSIEDAEKLKRSPGEKRQEMLSACELASMSIAQELRLSFDYFSTEKSKEVHTLFLTGGGALFDGMAEMFEKNLDIKVSVWNPLSGLKIAEGLSADDIKRSGLKLGVALGLALYDYD